MSAMQEDHLGVNNLTSVDLSTETRTHGLHKARGGGTGEAKRYQCGKGVEWGLRVGGYDGHICRGEGCRGCLLQRASVSAGGAFARGVIRFVRVFHESRICQLGLREVSAGLILRASTLTGFPRCAFKHNTTPQDVMHNNHRVYKEQNWRSHFKFG